MIIVLSPLRGVTSNVANTVVALNSTWLGRTFAVGLLAGAALLIYKLYQRSQAVKVQIQSNANEATITAKNVNAEVKATVENQFSNRTKLLAAAAVVAGIVLPFAAVYFGLNPMSHFRAPVVVVPPAATVG